MVKADRSCPGYPRFKSESDGGSRSTLPRAFRRSRADVSAANHLSASRGFNRALRTGKVSVQFDGFDLESGSHHDFRIFADDGSGGNGDFQQRIFITCRRNRDPGQLAIDGGYDGPGGHDPVSERSGSNEKVHRFGCRGIEESWRQVFKYQGESQRDLQQSEELGEELAFICEDQGAEKKSWEKDVSHCERAAEFDHVSFGSGRTQAPRESLSRNQAVIESDGRFVAADFVFSGNGFCGVKKDHSSSDVRAVSDSSRKSWEVGRVWFEVGNQSDRLFCDGIFDQH